MLFFIDSYAIGAKRKKTIPPSFENALAQDLLTNPIAIFSNTTTGINNGVGSSASEYTVPPDFLKLFASMSQNQPQATTTTSSSSEMFMMSNASLANTALYQGGALQQQQQQQQQQQNISIAGQFPAFSPSPQQQQQTPSPASSSSSIHSANSNSQSDQHQHFNFNSVTSSSLQETAQTTQAELFQKQQQQLQQQQPQQQQQQQQQYLLSQNADPTFALPIDFSANIMDDEPALPDSFLNKFLSGDAAEIKIEQEELTFPPEGLGPLATTQTAHQALPGMVGGGFMVQLNGDHSNGSWTNSPMDASDQ